MDNSLASTLVINYNRFMPNKKYIGIVKRKLWQHGYRAVVRSREVDGFDLLVNGVVKVKVFGGRTPRDVDVQVDGCDVAATVLTATFGRPLVGYFVVGNTTPLSKPSEAFGAPLSKIKKDHVKEKTRKEVSKNTDSQG